MVKNYLSELENIAKAHPRKKVRLIVKTSISADEASQYLVADKGVKIAHKYSIVNALALETSAKKALEISKKEWVVFVEEDKEIRALRRNQ